MLPLVELLFHGDIPGAVAPHSGVHFDFALPVDLQRFRMDLTRKVTTVNLKFYIPPSWKRGCQQNDTNWATERQQPRTTPFPRISRQVYLSENAFVLACFIIVFKRHVLELEFCIMALDEKLLLLSFFFHANDAFYRVVDAFAWTLCSCLPVGQACMYGSLQKLLAFLPFVFLTCCPAIAL